MPEQEENLTDALSKVEDLEQLKSVLPPSLTDRLGKGEKGVKRTVNMLVGLTPFAPEPATFDENAFKALVGVNYETNESLTEEEQEEMLSVALEAGFIQRVEQQTGNRFSVKEELQNSVKRAIGEG